MIRSLVLQPIDDTRKETGPIRLTDFPCTIGRGLDCDPRLNLHRISRHHLRVALEGDRIVIEDLGSTNGTFVNDERISEPVSLAPGDRLHIADYAFQVEKLSEIDQQASHRAGRPDTLAGQTIAGFTEDPTGFPVQAPHFYELLNDSLLQPLAIEAGLAHRPGGALIVSARSTHPGLNASHDRLARMARQLGEEARYHGILRQLAAEAADGAGLDNRLLILPVDALEVEDAAVLLSELGRMASRFRRLEFACGVDPSQLDATTLRQLRKSLDELGFELCAPTGSKEEDSNCQAAGITLFHAATDNAARPIRDFA